MRKTCRGMLGCFARVGPGDVAKVQEDRFWSVAVDLLLCGHAQDTAVSLPEEVQARLPLCEVEHARPIRGAICEGSAQNVGARGPRGLVVGGGVVFGIVMSAK